jgi:hypothetical protein
MRLDELAEVSYPRHLPVAADPDHLVRGAPESVRAARSGNQRVQRVADELDSGYTADVTAERLARLARWQPGGDGGSVAAAVDAGDAGGEAAGVRTNRYWHLSALAHCGPAATAAALGYLQVPVRAERQAARVVEAGCKSVVPAAGAGAETAPAGAVTAVPSRAAARTARRGTSFMVLLQTDTRPRLVNRQPGPRLWGRCSLRARADRRS